MQLRQDRRNLKKGKRLTSMKLNQHLHDAMAKKAELVDIELIFMGLGYTAVTTSDGGLGVAYTYFDHKSGCSLIQDYQDYEKQSAAILLRLIQHGDTLERSMALALINALNVRQANRLPEDSDNELLFKQLKIEPGSNVSMVGLIKPLVRMLELKGANVDIIDDFRNIGDKERFYHNLNTWSDAVLITSTTILNSTFEHILTNIGASTRVALLGPSTPMVAEAFAHWPMVKALAGIVPLEGDQLLKSVRHGLGTRHLHRHSRKVTLIV